MDAPPLHYSDYHRGQGSAFHEKACKLELEGIVSKRADAAYAPGNRGLWLKVKCLYREECVVIGWTDPEAADRGSAPCCSRITIPPEGWSMPAAPPPASSKRNCSGRGAGCNRLRPTKCRSTCRRRAPAASDRRWS